MSRLNINTIDESKQMGYKICGHYCAAHRFCVAINYKENVMGNETNCQLTNTTNHTFNDKAKKEEKIWTFRKVKADRRIMVSARELFNLMGAPQTSFSITNFLVKLNEIIEEHTDTILLGE